MPEPNSGGMKYPQLRCRSWTKTVGPAVIVAAHGLPQAFAVRGPEALGHEHVASELATAVLRGTVRVGEGRLGRGRRIVLREALGLRELVGRKSAPAAAQAAYSTPQPQGSMGICVAYVWRP